MKTKVFKNAAQEAADMIKNGALCAVPTETVYGLAGNGLDEQAVKKIYEVKGRPAIKPLSLMVHGAEEMEKYCVDVPRAARVLAEKFWPGPLTIVLKAKDFIPSIVLAGGTTVGLRCPQHPITLELLERAGCPFAAPSANPSGSESPKTAEKVLQYFDGKIEAVIDGGECGIGTESTIIDMTETPYRILRKGALSEEEIADALVSDMKLIGITGGTGCGKSTALNVLGEMGALIIDGDRVYHELLKTSTEMLSEINDRFPGTVKDGVLDRKALGAIVFSDEDALLDLNRITHAYVDRESLRRMRQHAMNGGTAAALDAIELLTCETGKLCKIKIAVIAPVETRAARIMARDGIDMERAMLRIKAQKPDSYFKDNCTYTLVNDADQNDFRVKCEKFFKEILENG